MPCVLSRCLGYALLPVLIVIAASGQIQHARVGVAIHDVRNDPILGAVAKIDDASTNFSLTGRPDEAGVITFGNLPFGSFALTVSAVGFLPRSQALNIPSNLPQQITIGLVVAPATSTVEVVDTAAMIAPDASSSTLLLGNAAIERTPHGVRTRQIQAIVAETPGIVVQNNGLLNIRGVEDGILYVIDGIPAGDRVDALNGATLDPEEVSSIKIFTGNVPAEFGGRSGAVVVVEPKSGLNRPVTGDLNYENGSYGTVDSSTDISGGGANWGLFSSLEESRSERYLDPPSMHNYNNRGGRAGGMVRAEWHPRSQNILVLNLTGFVTQFRIANDEAQEAAGQRARQELHNLGQSLTWQHVWSTATVTNLGLYRNYYRSQLTPSSGDTPISAAQDRHHVREGVLASLAHSVRGHTLQIGSEASRVSVQEQFAFFVTDQALATERDVSGGALRFNASAPFLFQGQLSRPQYSGYLQDAFQIGSNIAVSAGLRYDRSSLVVKASQWSPRLGVAYNIKRTDTTFRVSFNRLFMPPQIENLLLSDSTQARALSPFANQNGGGATIAPESTSAYEAGIVQRLKGFRLEIVPWWRSFRNFTDANVFFNTTVIFPNSVAMANAQGVDVRLEIPSYHGWSAFANYTNSRITAIGPINGGLFLTADFAEIGPGQKYTPDHDQRNVGSLALSYAHSPWKNLRFTFMARYQSGVPLDSDVDAINRLKALPGAFLVDFNRQRLKPWTGCDSTVSFDLMARKAFMARWRIDVQNLFNRQFAFNFGDPFEGTHFGAPRIWKMGLELQFKKSRSMTIERRHH
jgi:hypothetical protein